MTTTQAPDRTSTSNVLSILAIVFGAIAVLFLPIIIGVVGIVLGIVAVTRHEPLAKIGLSVAVIGTIIGMVLGAIVAS